MNIKQKKIKIEPRIKLKYNIYIFSKQMLCIIFFFLFLGNKIFLCFNLQFMIFVFNLLHIKVLQFFLPHKFPAG